MQRRCVTPVSPSLSSLHPIVRRHAVLFSPRLHTSPRRHLFQLAQIRGKATCCFLSHNLVTATIATRRSQATLHTNDCDRSVHACVSMHERSRRQFAGGWQYKCSYVSVSVRVCFSRLHACTRVHVGGATDGKRGTVERGNE